MAFPPDNINTNISPTEFELLVKEYLENVGKELKEFKVTHNVQILKSDGEYQIDVYAEFEFLGASFKLKSLTTEKRFPRILIQAKGNRISRSVTSFL